MPSSTSAWVGGAVVGWHLPVQVVGEGQVDRVGVRVVVMMKRVAVGRTAAGFDQAVGVRSRQEWYMYRYKMSRKQLVDISGQRVQADGGREVLVEGQEVWEEWMGQTAEDTDRRGKPRGSGGQWSKQQYEGVGQRTRKATRRMDEHDVS